VTKETQKIIDRGKKDCRMYVSLCEKKIYKAKIISAVCYIVCIMMIYFALLLGKILFLPFSIYWLAFFMVHTGDIKEWKRKAETIREELNIFLRMESESYLIYWDKKEIKNVWWRTR
jgi:hypothetical protein